MAARCRRLCTPSGRTNERWRSGGTGLVNTANGCMRRSWSRANEGLVHVQADEIRVKGCKMIAWMGLAMMVSTRLWLAGTVSMSRDKRLADALLEQVRRTAQILRPLLVLTDGWSAYPGSIRRAFREKVKGAARRGRAHLCTWPELHIGTVIKQSKNKRVVEITRQMAHGLLEQAEHLLQRSGGEPCSIPPLSNG